MKLDLWVNNEERDEVRTVGEFGWVWHEGDALRAGPGPAFGNEDAAGRVVARMHMHLWYLAEDVGFERPFTDYDVQQVLPIVPVTVTARLKPGQMRFGLADLVEAVHAVCPVPLTVLGDRHYSVLRVVDALVNAGHPGMTTPNAVCRLLGWPEVAE